ncbi:MAG: hypothetical protein EYC67_11075 [Betaproteobacteria bacterium]|nr:MAG: hypothetical protein EYC67_11075 [Betaproteobacteria bacterium]
MSESGVPLETSEVLRQEFDALHGRPQGGWQDLEDENARLKDVHDKIHALPSPRIALCLSGGGIRSATYCLGALQALASFTPSPPVPDPNEATSASQGSASESTTSEGSSQIERIHYLSTISGGGYIGGFLTALLERENFDYAKVAEKLRHSASPHLADGVEKCINWLRRYSNYLAPRRGWSTDTWSMVALFVRNMLLNWVVIIPAILLALLLPLLHLVALGNGAYHLQVLVVEGFIVLCWALAYPRSIRRRGVVQKGWLLLHAVLSTLAVGCLYWVVPFIGATDTAADGETMRRVAMLAASGALFLYWLASAFIALFAHVAEHCGWCRSANILRERLARGGGTALAIALAWVALHALVFYLPPLIMTLGAGGMGLLGAGGLAGLIAAVTGFWEKFSRVREKSWFARVSAFGLNLAAGAFIVIVLGAGGAMLNMQILQKVKAATAPSADAGPTATQQSAAADADYVRARRQFLATAEKWQAIGARKEFEPAVTETLVEHSSNRIRRAVSGALDEICDPGGDVCLLGLALRRAADTYVAALETLDSKVLLPPLLGFAFLALFGPAVVGVNRFNLGSFYENRLVRAYLGASNAKRDADQYSGFDEGDNLALSQCAPQYENARLFPVIGVALNLVRGSRLEWQQRKASSFTMSPLHCGGAHRGYRPTSKYSGPSGLTLGRAIAISGAAVSPNMGYHSSPLITFVLTFFNARLGWWLPNPGKIGGKVLGKREPGFLTRPIFDELLGRTTDERPFVYLSDGGHFDNLGLYEMVRRRCARILVIDATCDPDAGYSDLASTIRKIRVDLGISISLSFDAKTGSPAAAPFCMAQIDYPAVDGTTARTGYLIYVKPTLDHTVPVDVWRYAKSHFRKGDTFPHQSTGDQFFAEDQFESYRMLGFHNLTQVLEKINPLDDAAVERYAKNGSCDDRMDECNEPQYYCYKPDGGTRMLSDAAELLQSWASIGALATAVTIGGVVGVAGSVALQPGGIVSLAPNQTVAVTGSVPVSGELGLKPDQRINLEPNQQVRLEPDQKVGLEPGWVRLEPDQKVSVIGADGAVPPSIRIDSGPELRALIESNRALAASVGRLDATLAALRTDTSTMNQKLEQVRVSVDGVRTNTENLGFGRSAIEGRGGSR